MKTILVSGYRPFDLGIISDKDKRLSIIKTAIRKDLIHFLEEGAEWFVFMGNLGFEYWTLEVLKELRIEGYNCQIATIFCFENHGENWNESNQLKLTIFKTVDFVKYAFLNYQNPSQYRDYHRFLLGNTDGAYIFYDSEQETNLKYLVHDMAKKDGYTKKTLTFERLNELAEVFEKN